MEPLGRGEVMAYQAVLTNPLPKGSIDTRNVRSVAAGGPGEHRADRQVHVRQRRSLDGEGDRWPPDGRLAKFQGQLDRIAVTGETRTPDFFVKVSGNPVPLETKFEAVVDGTDGDTISNDVSGSFLNTALTAAAQSSAPRASRAGP